MSDPTRRALRTVVQFMVGVATALPMMAAAPGVTEALPWLVQAAVAGVAARFMASPLGVRLTPPWLRVPGLDGLEAPARRSG